MVEKPKPSIFVTCQNMSHPSVVIISMIKTVRISNIFPIERHPDELGTRQIPMYFRVK